MEYGDLIRGLPRPTADHYRAFAKFLRGAHSWYKHLPLMTGGEFVVFLAPDAGTGNKVAAPDPAGGYRLVTPPDSPEFTEVNPRLHYAWTTTKEYRQRFGYLDYQYRFTCEQTYSRDAGEPVSLPGTLHDCCGFTLYP
jgi:hypothetical protein